MLQEINIFAKKKTTVESDVKTNMDDIRTPESKLNWEIKFIFNWKITRFVYFPVFLSFPLALKNKIKLFVIFTISENKLNFFPKHNESFFFEIIFKKFVFFVKQNFGRSFRFILHLLTPIFGIRSLHPNNFRRSRKPSFLSLPALLVHRPETFLSSTAEPPKSSVKRYRGSRRKLNTRIKN